MEIYLVRQTGTQYYKIGISKQVDKRILQLQTANAVELVLVYKFETKFNYKLETALHQRYILKKVNSEWFEFSDCEIEDFPDICKKLEESFFILKKYNNPFV